MTIADRILANDKSLASARPDLALARATRKRKTMPDPTPLHATPQVSSQALDSVRDELLALDPRTLLALNVDVASAALVVIGATPELRKHRAALAELCGEDNAKTIDRLELLARVAIQAHAKHLSVFSGADVQPLSEQLVVVRDVLLAEVRSMIVRKVLPAGIVREVVLGTGYKNQCVDVLQLVSAMRDNWDIVEHETRISVAYLESAEGLANQLVSAVSLRDQPSRSPSADLRLRAFTLLARTYDCVRRMITYLRWEEGDADGIAPGFHNNRGSRRRKEPAVTEIVTEITEPVAPGLPGGSPFISG